MEELSTSVENLGKMKKAAARQKLKQVRTGNKVAQSSLPPPPETVEDGSRDDCASPPGGIEVSTFDYSVENHFRAIDTISKLCGETDRGEFDQPEEFERLSSTITFLREWKHFSYQPKTIRFACETEAPEGKDVSGGISLPQFSAATVPKKDRESGGLVTPNSCKDFVMYVGGSVWALDWCPFHQASERQIKSEFIAVAAHPPESSCHKIGAPLVGRGIIQIWCLLNITIKEKDMPSQVKKKRNQKPRPGETVEGKSNQPKRSRGRPRKKPLDDSVDKTNSSREDVQAFTGQTPQDSSTLLAINEFSEDTPEHLMRKGGDRKRTSELVVSADDSMLTASANKKLKDKATSRGKIHGDDSPSVMFNENAGSFFVDPHAPVRPGQAFEGVANDEGVLESNPTEASIPKQVALPRLVFCLAHNGKVAWDVKWRPCNVDGVKAKHTMGYLAVLLGNGALEVWEVPYPDSIKTIYSSCQKEGTDPRFIKLEPVFRCSMLKCGDRQSIPLTVEWSTSFPHDLILVGCHDGVVALWKFTTNSFSKDTRPLLCFSADTVPIRALAWAPLESDPESANVIVTAGHRGLKFWDIRDPFHPLWDLNPVQRVIYSLDWLPNPRCLLVSFDDGTLRVLSLAKAANNGPVTGHSFSGTQHQGLNSYLCTSFAIWSVQASRETGMVAYCSADGTVLRFQLTTREVERDPLRNRAPHFLCGSLVVEESCLTVVSPLPDIPFPMKKSLNEWANAPRTIRGYLSVSNQEKRAREQMANGQPSADQPPAICYGNDPGIESGCDEVLEAPKSKKAPKSRAKGKKKSKDDQPLVCRDEELEDIRREDKAAEIGDKIESFPPKIVAMHRVRWNMNKGSERWLCYGGAGGIVRSQEIYTSDLR